MHGHSHERLTNQRSLLLIGGMIMITFFLFFLSTDDQKRENPKTKNIEAPQTLVTPHSKTTQIPVIDENKEESSIKGDKDRILILSPVKDVEDVLPRYFKNLDQIDYDKKLISLGFLEGDSEDGTYEYIKNKLPELEKKYRRVILLQKNFAKTRIDEWERHRFSLQKERRSIMAKSRNYLLFNALSDEDWVFWLDSDLYSYKPDIIRVLLATGKDVVIPNCLSIRGGTYDSNNWQETDKSRELIKTLQEDDVLFEGYSEISSGRKHLGELLNQDWIIPLDGVGATALFVKADIHREGAIFPPIPFKHQLESEGFAKMATDMGYKLWGLTNYSVIHEESI